MLKLTDSTAAVLVLVVDSVPQTAILFSAFLDSATLIKRQPGFSPLSVDLVPPQLHQKGHRAKISSQYNSTGKKRGGGL